MLTQDLLRDNCSASSATLLCSSLRSWSRKAACSRMLSEWSFETRRRFRMRSEEHTSELQSQSNIVCRLLLEKKIKTDHRKSRIIHRRKPRAGRPCYHSHDHSIPSLP